MQAGHYAHASSAGTTSGTTLATSMQLCSTGISEPTLARIWSSRSLPPSTSKTHASLHVALAELADAYTDDIKRL